MTSIGSIRNSAVNDTVAANVNDDDILNDLEGPQEVDRVEDIDFDADVDECNVNLDGNGNVQSPCGRGAVCQNTIGSFRCFCTYDMTVLGPHEDCRPTRTFSDNMNTGVGVFKTEDLYDIVKPIQSTISVRPSSNGSTTTTTTSNVTNTTHEPSSMIITHTGHVYALPMLVGITTAALIMAVIVVTIVLCFLRYRPRQRLHHRTVEAGAVAVTIMDNNTDKWGDKFPFCCCYWQPPKSAIGLKALRKSAILGSQQFTANPNYYTTSPELVLLKSLMHLEISGEKLVFLDIIGEGCFGKVFKGLFQKSETEVCEVAVKILKENSSNENQVDFLREVEIMSSFNHPNILALLGVVVIENGSTPWMVFEYMEYGDLAELLRGNSPHLWSVSRTSCKITKNDLHWLAAQVAHGMEYLSSQHFVHRDLATRNCLVGHDLIVKISDFGMSRDIYTCDYYKIGGSRMLPIRWMAPESVMYGKFTLESDIWSYGVVIWEIFAYGKQPYYGHTNEEVVKLIRQRILLQPPEDCPRYVSTLMDRCWNINPHERIKFAQIIEYLRRNDSDVRQRDQSGNAAGAGAVTTPNGTVYTVGSIRTNNNNNNNDNINQTTSRTTADHDNYLIPRRN